MKTIVVFIGVMFVMTSCSLMTSFEDEEATEICTNDIDDDGDGHTDCDDQDCLNHDSCQSTEDEICDNDVDDDGDGNIDCDDPDCASAEWCNINGEICDNDVDDDGDGNIDCGDLECSEFPGCNNGEDCTNGIDDDMDGLIDCDDQDCESDPFCVVISCEEYDAWWNATSPGCTDSTSCTFFMDFNEFPPAIYPQCMVVSTDNTSINCGMGNPCSKGSVCANGACVIVCNNVNHFQCPPDSFGGENICKTKDIHPWFGNYSYCVSGAQCEPMGNSNDCPPGHLCKINMEENAGTTEIMTYCVPNMASNGKGDYCESSDECFDNMVCDPMNNVCAILCDDAADCFENGEMCEPINPMHDMIGYCTVPQTDK